MRADSWQIPLSLAAAARCDLHTMRMHVNNKFAEPLQNSFSWGVTAWDKYDKIACSAHACNCVYLWPACTTRSALTSHHPALCARRRHGEGAARKSTRMLRRNALLSCTLFAMMEPPQQDAANACCLLCATGASLGLKLIPSCGLLAASATLSMCSAWRRTRRQRDCRSLCASTRPGAARVALPAC